MSGAQKIVGRRVGEIRRALRHTQERVAEAAGVDVSYVARLEAGRLNPTLTKLEAIAAALDVPVAELLRDEPLQRNGVPRPLIDAVRGLAADDVACLVDVARRMSRPARRRSRT